MIAILFWAILLVTLIVDLYRNGLVGERLIFFVLFILLGVSEFGFTLR